MYVKVRVRAGAKREEIQEKSKDHLELSVKEPAEANLANRRVMALVAAHFKVPVARVRIVSGHHSPGKILSVDV
jgi:hypothetical protein